MPLDRARLEELVRGGWELTRDGSTATARRAWEDPEEPEDGWELLVLHTSGHPPRFSLSAFGSGLTERPAGDLQGLSRAVAEAADLLADWRGELPS